MNLASLPKNKRNALLLGAMSLLLVLTALYLFVITPWTARRAARITALKEINTKIETAEKTKAHMPEAAREADEVRSRVAVLLTTHLPPSENTFLWTTRVMDQATRRENLSLDAINELIASPPDWVRSPEEMRPEPPEPASDEPADADAPPVRAAPKKMFGPYRAVCSISGDFRDMVAMLDRLQKENPLIVIHRLNIVSDASAVRQKADLVLEWPQHSGPMDPKLAEFLLSNMTMDIPEETP